MYLPASFFSFLFIDCVAITSTCSRVMVCWWSWVIFSIGTVNILYFLIVMICSSQERWIVWLKKGWGSRWPKTQKEDERDGSIWVSSQGNKKDSQQEVWCCWFTYHRSFRNIYTVGCVRMLFDPPFRTLSSKGSTVNCTLTKGSGAPVDGCCQAMLEKSAVWIESSNKLFFQLLSRGRDISTLSCSKCSLTIERSTHSG